MIEHPTVPLTTPDGVEVDIDVELADVLDLAWQAGCHTVWSCQDHGEAVVEEHSRSHLRAYRQWHLGWSVIEFTEGESLCTFMDAVAGGGPRDELYIRMVHAMAPGAWRTGVRLWDYAITADEKGRPPEASSFEPRLARVMLPRTDVRAASDRLARWLDGYQRPSRAIDWDTVGWD